MSSDPNSPQVVARLLTQAEAGMLVAHLESQGIKADIWGASGTNAAPEIPSDVQVVVRAADLDKAKEAVEKLRQKRSKGG
jgi:Putative prokaryotic signal transducing protein